MDVIQEIENFVITTMAQIQSDLVIAHDFKHVDRVRKWAVTIAVNEGVTEMEVIEATALLHDIGLAHVQDRKHHAEVGAQVAAEYLQANRFFSADKIAAISEAIRCHNSLQGGGWLGSILRDADALDLFGAVGIMRAFTSKYMNNEYDPSNIRGRSWGMTADDFTTWFQSGIGFDSIIDQINFQISCYDNLNGNTAKEIAKPHVEFMKAFIVQLEGEIRYHQKDNKERN